MKLIMKLQIQDGFGMWGADPPPQSRRVWMAARWLAPGQTRWGMNDRNSQSHYETLISAESQQSATRNRGFTEEKLPYSLQKKIPIRKPITIAVLARARPLGSGFAFFQDKLFNQTESVLAASVNLLQRLTSCAFLFHHSLITSYETHSQHEFAEGIKSTCPRW